MNLLIGSGLVFAASLMIILAYAFSRRRGAAHWANAEAFATIVAVVSTTFLGFSGAAFSWFFEAKRTELAYLTPTVLTALAIVAAIVVLIDLQAITSTRRLTKATGAAVIQPGAHHPAFA